jgi:RND family efflux transporter MFP subunit
LINSGAGGPATELFHIADTRSVRVFIDVPQDYSQAAQPGLMADLTLQEFPSKRFKGKLVRTANAIDPSSRTLLVEVDVDNPKGDLLPGAYGQVHLKAAPGTPAVILPVSAMLFRSEGLQVAIVENGNRAQLRSVTAGRDFGNEIEVVSGIKPSDWVIDKPSDSLISGESVRIADSAPGNGNSSTAANPQ